MNHAGYSTITTDDPVMVWFKVDPILGYLSSNEAYYITDPINDSYVMSVDN